MSEILAEKYDQVEGFASYLDNLMKEGEVPIELTADRFWGIGQRDIFIADRTLFREFTGANWLGKLLMLLLITKHRLPRKTIDTIAKFGCWGIDY